MTAEELAELARLDAVATQLQTLVDDLRESAKNGVMAGILRAASESPDVAALRKALNENADKLAAAREREARLREALLGLPELEATFAKAQVRIVDLEVALAEARAALPKGKYLVACPLCPHWMHLHEDGRCESGRCPCNEPSAALTAEEFEDAEGK